MDPKHLLKYSLFDNFSENEVQKFIEIIKNKSYKENEMIITENEIGDSMMLLLKGTISVSKALTIKINEIEKREKEFIKLNNNQYPFFGEISIFNNNKRTATIKADTECEIGILYNKDLIKMFDIEYHTKNVNLIYKRVLK